MIHQQPWARLACVTAVAVSLPCAAQTTPTPHNAELAALRQEIEALRTHYETRLHALEQRLSAAEAAGQAKGTDTATEGAKASSSPTPFALAARAQALAPAPGAAGANAFNPAMSLVLSGLYARTSLDPASARIKGVALPPTAEVGPGSRGFSLAETELGLAAHIDPFWRGAANLSLHPDNSVSVEEAYVQTTALGRGLGLKAGRFFSNIGYLNAQHSHTWDFVDNPIAYQALLGTQYGDDGVQLRWLAPSERFVELSMELGRGRGFPGADNARNGAGMFSLSARTGGDLGESHSWRAGVSMLNTQAQAQELTALDESGQEQISQFSGRSRVWLLDGVWKWAPNGNATRTSFKLQGEWLHSTREGTLLLNPGGSEQTGTYRAVASGGYLQAVYQFMPAWRVGVRTERLNADAPQWEGSGLANQGGSARKQSLMLDFNASEFSRIRLQWARDASRPDGADRQLFLQYQMSLGAHGAHSY